MIKTLFDGNEIPKEKTEYFCTSCISIDSILKVDKKYYPQVYLEQCKYKAKKREIYILIMKVINNLLGVFSILVSF